MIQKIEIKEIMTLSEATVNEKYTSKWFIFVFTEKVSVNIYDTKGYVAYIFDNEREMYKNGEKNLKGLSYTRASGVKTNNEDSFSSIYYHD